MAGLSSTLYWTKELQALQQSDTPESKDGADSDKEEQIDLVRSRAKVALADGVDSPYAFIGIAQKIHSLGYGLSAETHERFEKFVAENKAKIRSYIQLFQCMDIKFIKEHGDACIHEGSPKKRLYDILDNLETNPHEIDWHEIVAILYVTAHWMEDIKQKR